jgi:putative endonuclease
MRAARPQEIRRRRGTDARHAGRWAEAIAAAWLLAKGWRILGFRLKTPQGEIDLLARRGGVLAVVEVKTRPTLDESLAAVSPAQQGRLLRAGAAIAAKRRDLSGLFVRLDMVALAPGRRPRHIPDAWGRTGDRIQGAPPRR